MKKLTQTFFLAVALLWFPAEWLTTAAIAQNPILQSSEAAAPATEWQQKRLEALQERSEQLAAARARAHQAGPSESRLDAPQGKWTPRAPLPAGPRERAFNFVIGDKFYVGTGRSYRGWVTGSDNESDVWAYDFATDKWEELNPFPGGGIRNAASFVIDGIAYIVTGHDGADYLDLFWKYDPATDTWEELPPFPGGVRSFPVAFAIDGKGYVALGGVEPPVSFYANDLWEYDPSTAAWTQLADFPGQGRWRGFAFVIDGQAYVGGGNPYEVSTAGFNDCYRFNPADGTWAPIADFPEGWSMGCYAAAIDGKAYVGEGSSHGYLDTYRTKLWEYDPGADAWTHVSYTPGPQTGRILSYSAAYDGKLYMGGGRTNSWNALYSQFFGDFQVWDKTAAPATPDYEYWESLGRGEVDEDYIGIFAIRAIDESTVWALPTATFTDYAAPLQVMFTSDGGANWQTFTADDERGYISGQLYALDGDRAWVMGALLDGSTNLFRTQDGGQSWEKILDGADNLMNDSGGIHFFDDEVGLCWGNDFGAESRVFLYRTTDGGATWQLLDDPAMPGSGSFEWSFVTSGNNNYAAVGDTIWIPVDYITLRSTDRGATWARTDYDVFDGSIYSIAFEDGQRGMTITDNWPGIVEARGFVTEDGGANWLEIPLPLPTALSITHIPGSPGAYMAYSTIMWDPRLAYTPNYGQDWIVLQAPPALHAIQFLSPEVAYAGGPLRRDVPEGVYRWKGDLTVFDRLYVKADATGANTGRTWEDAFTDLQDALAIATPGEEIWVAEGVYTPAAPGGPRTATYLVDKDLSLYGGFAGTESRLDERGNPADHPAILSGDLNGDDVDGDFETNRSDNVYTVVSVAPGTTGLSLIDGFTLRGGHADGPGAGPDVNGGGLRTQGKPIVQNCIFEHNYAQRTGGGMVFANELAGGEVRGCTFRQNRANSGGGLSIFFGEYLVEDCIFEDNLTFSATFEPHGGGVYIVDGNGSIRDCEFVGNFSPAVGGGIFAWSRIQSVGVDLEVTGSNFQDNQAASGGGLALSALGNETAFATHNCSFVDNNAAEDGGGLFYYVNSTSSDARLAMEGCTFEGNEATDNGGGAYAEMRGQDVEVSVKRCTFLGNTAVNGVGTLDLTGIGGGTGSALVDSCHFENNSALYSGGVEMVSGFEGGANFRFVLSHSSFIANEAQEGAAGSFFSDQNSPADFLIEHCLFDSNAGVSAGGAILFHPHSSDFRAVMKNCIITNNQSLDGSGLKAFPLLTLPNFPAGASVHIENTLVGGNFGGSAAISVEKLPNFSLFNVTVANNEGDGVSLRDQSGLSLQNTILFNPGYVEGFLSNNSSFTSLGGNLFGDGSLNEWLNNTDQPSADPLLDGAYQLGMGSPAVDAGLDYSGMADFDLAGNARLQGSCVDIGAYESPFDSGQECPMIVGTRDLPVRAGAFLLHPNPAGDFLFVQLPESGAAPFLLQLLDAQGRLLGQYRISEGAPLDVALLPAGLYGLKAVVDGTIFSGKFVKQ